MTVGETAPLVLLHGFTGAPASWDRVLARLGRRDALRPALGLAPSFEAEVDRLAGEWRAAGLAPVDLAGYSMGARVALGLAVRHPDRVARLTLVGVHPGLETDAERAERAAGDERWAALLEREGVARFVAAWEDQPLFATQLALPPDVRAAHRAIRLAHAPDALARALRALSLARMPSLWPALPGLAVPVRLVVGEADPKFRALAARAAALLARATLQVVPGCGHDVPLEDPAAFAALFDEGPRFPGKEPS